MNPSLLPDSATNAERAYCLATARVGDVPVTIKETWSAYKCPVSFLPWLAWSLSVDDWDNGWSENQKRKAIADSVEIHRKKGTIGALKRALQKLNYEVIIDENTGQAYTFRLIVNVINQGISDWSFTEAERVALAAKNVRSYLASIRGLVQSQPALLNVCSVELDGITTKVFPST